MQIEIKDITAQEVDAMIVSVFEESTKEDKQLEQLKHTKAFSGKEDELYVLSTVNQKIKHTIYIGLGKQADFVTEEFRKIVAKAVQKAVALKAKTIGIPICVHDKLCVGGNIKAISEAVLLGTYTFDQYKSKKEDLGDTVVYISNVPQEKKKRAHEVLQESTYTIEGILLARNLTNEPSNRLYPEILANRTIEALKNTPIQVEVFDEHQIEALGMKAFLAVGGSSAHKPRLIVMRYHGNEENNETLGLVGKGLTYDTGGYSLKPTNSMKTMHSDMGGGAAVIGAMYAIGKNKPKCNVTAVVAACENVIAPDSYKPGDIIDSMSGKTIEIGNTDAEGRLTLADAVTYAIEKEKANRIIDVATLTGAVLTALGNEYTGVLTNNLEFYDELIAVSKKTGEKFWQLPNDKAFAKLNKSSVADLKNIGGHNGGTITAGLFVGEFVKELPWLHLDIAGTAWIDKEEGYKSKGATGVPVKTLYQLVATPCPCGHK